ncbi:hypothetical protein ScPMuIL_018841 [Solemya velum]
MNVIRFGRIGLIKRNATHTKNIHRLLFNMASREILKPYEPPAWAKHLKYLPTKRVSLACSNTPIHEWNLPGIPSDFSVSIKRDDLTGSTLSGNKVRKLEFLFADAIQKGCKHVITCGGIQSNHCRAVAVAARQLGLQPHLLLRGDLTDAGELGCEGNVLLDRLCGAHIHLVPKFSPYLTKLKPRMEKLAAKIKSETGEDTYLIPVGGSNEVGVFGYINVFQELLEQGLAERFDDLVFACGSGGTAAGLCIANFLSGTGVRCHAVKVSDSADYFHEHINQTLRDVGLDLEVKSEEIIDIVSGYKGIAYGVSTDEELGFLAEVSSTTGIMVDPVYTGKAVRGLVQELNKNPHRFKGRRVLFLHTGGIFGLFDGRMDAILKTEGSITDRIHLWPDPEGDPS